MRASSAAFAGAPPAGAADTDAGPVFGAILSPPGITLQVLGKGQGYDLGKQSAAALPRDEIAFADERGLTLYTYRKDTAGKSTCVALNLVRRAFVARDCGVDPVLLSADYSQIELRVLAHLSGDEALSEAFRRGEDIHDRTAERVFGTNSGLDPKELRRRAKIINYALLYGKTAFTLARDINVPKEAAQAFIDAYFAGFPRVRAYIDATLEEGRATGAVKTLFGRRRLVPNLTSSNFQIRAQAERETVEFDREATKYDLALLDTVDTPEATARREATSARSESSLAPSGGRGGPTRTPRSSSASFTLGV